MGHPFDLGIKLSFLKGDEEFELKCVSEETFKTLDHTEIGFPVVYVLRENFIRVWPTPDRDLIWEIRVIT